MKVLRAIIYKLERLLRIDESLPVGVILRSRMIYATGFVYLLGQLINMTSMTIVYGQFTQQHLISIASCVIFLGASASLRYTKSATFYGVLYSVLTIGGISVAASLPSAPDIAPFGINSPLLPIVCTTTAVIAFISTRRVSIIFMASTLVMILYLYMVTMTYYQNTLGEVLAWQRAVQTSIAILIVGPICTVIGNLVFQNLDELESAVSRARHAEAAKTSFLATMSHEIRTPLNGILAMSDMLSRSELPATEARYANLIQTSSSNLMEIINEVLDLARMEGTGVEIANKPFNIRELLQGVTDLYSLRAEEKSLWIGTHIDENIPETLIGDAPHLRQIINNLASNALKFTREGGVRVGAQCLNIADNIATVQFYVQDSGYGISAEDQAKIFDRFSQSESAATSAIKGTGLGLAICQELSEAMGGELRVKSAKGEGSIFYFTLQLPLEVEAQTGFAA